MPGEDRGTDKVGTFSPHVSLPEEQLEEVRGVFEEAGYRVTTEEHGPLSPGEHYLLVREPGDSE